MLVDKVCGPWRCGVMAAELGYLHHVRRAGPARVHGSKASGGGHSAKLKLYVEWVGAGRDVGPGWVAVHASLGLAGQCVQHVPVLLAR